MKKGKLLIFCIIPAVLLWGCGRGEVRVEETRPSAAMLELGEAAALPLPAAEGEQPELDLSCEGSTVWFGGKPYLYRAIESPTDAQKLTHLGALRYQAEGWGELTVDREALDGCPVYHLTGGRLTEEALLVTDPEGKGQLYYPEGYFEGYEKEFQYTEDGTGGIAILKYRGKGSHVTIPAEIDGKKVTALGTMGLEGVFGSCPTVISVTVPEGVAVIWDDCFYGCPRLEEVYLPVSLKAVGSCAFNACPALRALHFAGDAPKAGNCLFDQDVPPAAELRTAPGTTGWSEEPWNRFPQTEN